MSAFLNTIDRYGLQASELTDDERVCRECERPESDVDLELVNGCWLCVDCRGLQHCRLCGRLTDVVPPICDCADEDEQTIEGTHPREREHYRRAV